MVARSRLLNFVVFQQPLKQLLAVSAILAISVSASAADHALIAVASNFALAAEELEKKFEASHSHEIDIATGSTGRLYAQIKNGAPFDVFLAADEMHPALLDEQGAIVNGSRFTYAIGRLLLWSRIPLASKERGLNVLLDPDVRMLALPNPELAPFGAAAMEILARDGIAQQINKKLVFAENVGQSFAFVATGNVNLGFVSGSYLAAATRVSPDGWTWLVPENLHRPIRQDAVLLLRAAENPAAIAFHSFLKEEEAQLIITQFGYGLP